MKQAGTVTKTGIRAGLAALLLCQTAIQGAAQEFAAPMPDLPAVAVETARVTLPRDGYKLAVGSWEDGQIPQVLLQGASETSAWRIPEVGADTLALGNRIRDGLGKMGYAPIFACATDACGGFDFRYELKVLPEPDMHVDLSDFRYLAALRGQGEKAEYAMVLVSRAGTTGFVQLTYIGAEAAAPLPAATTAPATPQAADTDPAVPADVEAEVTEAPQPAVIDAIGTFLERDGHVVLDGLSFASGASSLDAGAHPSLEQLAAYLIAHPDRRIVIVGHTDATGSDAANLALSRSRALSVAEHLIKEYGVPSGQVSADGVGSLAPVASNLTEEGRQKNRRVEAVLASTR
ncbi:MAG: OmpA family protein [Paracoccaceae bacterium]